MPVVLRRANDLPQMNAYTFWFATGSSDHGLDPSRQLPEYARRLEHAFEEIRDDWFDLGRRLGIEPTAEIAHAPTCAPNASDQGLMLAWSWLVEQYAAMDEPILVICDDPWLYRHLRGFPGVKSARPPVLWRLLTILALRGWAARASASLRLAWWSIALRRIRGTNTTGSATLVVYGHPSSTVDGIDGYFGSLMERLGKLHRILHVDCRASRARVLSADSRTASLHGWGSVAFALTLAFRRWRPSADARRGPAGWLVRRAAAIEGGTGSGAMNAWQIHCQRRWLLVSRPRVIAWPWENHGWERALARTARSLNIETVGYQHSVVGQQWNLAPSSNADGETSLPDRIFCNSDSGIEQLVALGHRPEHLEMAGSLRFAGLRRPRHDPDAPVLVAVPFDGPTGRQMVRACSACAGDGYLFMVKDHPMTPLKFTETDSVRRSDQGFNQQPAISAVIFAATTVGLESWLAGIPTIRFIPDGRIALNILPAEASIPVATAVTFSDVLADLPIPTPPPGEHFFGVVDYDLWHKLLSVN